MYHNPNDHDADFKTGSYAASSGWSWIKDNGESIKITFAVIAAIWALAEYKAKDYLERVKNATQTVEEFYVSKGFNSLMKLDDLWMSEDLADKRKRLSSGKMDSASYRSYVFEKAKYKYKDDFLQATRGLKTVAICGIQGRCERTTLCMYVAQAAQDLRCNFRENIVDLSESNGGCIIDEMNYFLDTYCVAWIGQFMGVKNYRGIEDNACLFDNTKRVSKLGRCSQSLIYKQPISILRAFWD